MPAKTLSKKEYADHRGVSPSMVTKWRQLGAIKLTADGRVLVDESDAMLAANQAPDRGGRRSSSRTAGNGAQSGRGGPQSPPAPDSTMPSFNTARTAREVINARSAELDLNERLGRLIEKDRYDKAVADSLGPAISKLESLSSRIAHHVPEDLRRRITAVIDDEIVNIRQEIADALRSLLASSPTQTRQ